MTVLRACFVALTLTGVLAWGARARADGPAPQPAPPPGAPAPGGPAPGAPGAPAPGAPAKEDAKRALTFANDKLIERADGNVTYFYRTNFVTATDLVNSVKVMNLEGTAAGGIGVTFQPFQAQNQVLVVGPPEAVEIALDALAYFDVAAPQVYLEAKVVELTSDSNFEYGLDYSLNRNISGSDTFWRGITGFLSPPSAIAATLPGALPFQGTNLLFGLIPGAGGSNTALKFGAFDLTLQALQANGKAEILSKPSIICTQGKEARVTTTEEFEVNRIVNGTRNTNIAPNGDITLAVAEASNPAAANTGVTLIVTAVHIGESFVTIDLNPTVTGLAGASSRLGGTQTPIKTTRSAKTVVTMADGETLVIGGLYTNRLVKEESRTPLLSDIPGIGTLFTRQNESKQKTELVFILTPRIIRKNVDARVILPPAELERLEQKSGDGDDRCGPCAPMNSMEDVLYPKGAACRRRHECEAKRAATQTAASKSSTPAPAGPPTTSSRTSSSAPPPPPPPPEPPAQVRAR